MAYFSRTFMEGMKNVGRLPENFQISQESCLKGVTIKASAEKSCILIWFLFFFSTLFNLGFNIINYILHAPPMVSLAIRCCRRL